MTERRGAMAARPERGLAEPSWRTYRAFGLTWKTDITWPETVAEAGDPDADVLLQLVQDLEIDRRWSGRAEDDDQALVIDEMPFVVERGKNGDFRLSHAGKLFHVSADGRSVACGTADPSDPSWLRLTLDTVCWFTALRHGVEALHASAVEGEKGVVAFLGRMGGGKTTLALEFLRRDWRLFCDDVLVVRRTDDGVMAYPSPPFLNVPIVHASDTRLPITPIATLGDETWAAATSPSRGPSELQHLVIVDRAPGLRLEFEPARSSLLELRQFCLAYGQDSERERARFDLCADLAAQVPVSHLRADLETTPRELADLIEAALS